MNWQDYYSSRLISIDDAAAKIKDNDFIVYGHGTGEPVLFAGALLKRADELSNVRIYHGIGMGPGLYCDPSVNSSSIKHVTVFAGAKTRKAVQEGRADCIPMHFSDMPEGIRQGLTPATVAILHLTPPDRFGYCSMGISCDYERAALETAKLVIAEVNSRMPRTYGDTMVHVSEVDYFVQTDCPLYTMAPPNIGEVEKKIAGFISELVEDGACLQLGMGAIPNAIMEGLKDRNDLGIHTELLSDGAMELIKAGVVTNTRKNIHKGKSVCTFASGTTELYEWLNDNPMVEFYPVDYINNAHVVSLNDKVFSVNSAIQVDLQGQVCAETINGKQFSGIGGQMDFVRGATWSKGGKSIIAMPASTKNDTISKIVSVFKPGDAITTPRNDVDYVVTEYGVAHLRGQGICERARRLIEIAHPNFRDQLKEQFTEVYGFKL